MAPILRAVRFALPGPQVTFLLSKFKQTMRVASAFKALLMPVGIGMTAACPALLVYFATLPRGAGLTPDSVWYIATARAIEQGQPLPAEFVYWPPLYPALLAAFSWILGKADPIHAAVYYETLVTFASGVAAGVLLLRQQIRNRAWFWIGLISASFCQLTFDSELMAWSEPTYLLFTLISMIFLDRCLREDKWRFTVLAALFAGAAFMTRYIGFTLPLSSMVVLAFNRRWTVERRIRNIAIYGLLAFLPMLPWFLRNELLNGTLTGPRPRVNEALSDQLGLALKWLMIWPPMRICALLAAAGMLLTWFRPKDVAPAVEPRLSRPMSCLWADPAAFLIFIAGLASVITFDALNERLISPSVLPLFLFLLAWIDRLISWLGDRSKLASGVTLVALFFFIVVNPLYSVVGYVLECTITGAGAYNRAYWTDEPLLKALAGHPQPEVVESNAPEALALFLGWHATMTPQREDSGIAALKGHWPVKPDTTIIWFKASEWRHYLYSPAELESIADMQVVAQSPNSTMFSARPKPP